MICAVLDSSMCWLPSLFQRHFDGNLLSITDDSQIEGIALLAARHQHHVIFQTLDRLAVDFHDPVVFLEPGLRGRGAFGDATEVDTFFVVAIGWPNPKPGTGHPPITLLAAGHLYKLRTFGDGAQVVDEILDHVG